MVSRMLEAGGVRFGVAEDLAGPNSDNPHGFWEHYGLREINESLLERFGGSWRNPPKISAQLLASPELDDLRKRAQDLLSSLGGSSPCWGWKDPRTSLVLPFWLSILQQSPSPILCLRHPSDVGASLARRNKISPGLAGFLWQEYTASACAALDVIDALVLSYENILQDPLREATRCARFFAKSGVDLDPALMVTAVDIDLAHHQVGDQDFPGWWEGGQEAYAHLSACAKDEASLSAALVKPPTPSHGFQDLMAEASNLATALDFRESAYADRVQETQTAMSEKDTAEQNLANAVQSAADQEAKVQELSIMLEECRSQMDNLARRREVRLGQSIRNVFRS